MKKIARFGERWVDRRHDTVPPRLPTAAENDEDNQDGAPPASRSKMMSLVRSSLCNRCQVLRKDLQTPSFFHQCVVEISSLSFACQYCRQFLEIFKLTNRLDKIPYDSTCLTLSRRVLTYGNERVRRFDLFDYIEILVGARGQNVHIRLFPSVIKLGSTPYILGKCIDPGCADFDMFKAVLHNCRTRHTSTCTPSPTDPSLLRLIDCRDRRITPASRHQRYICLSYVWGRQIDESPIIDGILPDSVPKTVEDAMFVAMQFGIPFLWVDRYCIDQRKLQEKHNIIRNMDKIYHGAELTIIASVGEDPHHGLPGVRGTLRKPQYQLQLGNDSYVAAKPGREEITGSKWGTRGWTYQEMLLSCRRLVFTETQMYFQCMIQTKIESLSPDFGSSRSSGHATGDTIYPVENPDFKDEYQIDFDDEYRVFPQQSMEGHAGYLNDRLCEYYKRQLSFCADTIDAFLGIVNFYGTSRSTGEKITQFYGVLLSYYGDASEYELPCASFLEGLLWSVCFSRLEEEDPWSEVCHEVVPYVIPHTFPSWSWASIKAAQPLDNLGHFVPTSGLWPYDYNMYRGIEVRVQHRHEGIRQVADIPYHKDDYKCFMPWIDITAWTRPCKVTRLSLHSGVVSLYSDTITIHDPLVLENREVHAVCLKVMASVKQILTVSASGLLVVETKPETYRRVAKFVWEIDLQICKQTDVLDEDFERLFDGLSESENGDRLEKLKRLEDEGWAGPQVLERLSVDSWQKRTMRLI